MSIVYGPLGTAIEQVHVGDANAEQALAGANDSMSSLLSEQSSAEPYPLSPGYRTISITVPVNSSAIAYEIFVDNITHSTLLAGTFGSPSTGYHSSCKWNRNASSSYRPSSLHRQATGLVI